MTERINIPESPETAEEVAMAIDIANATNLGVADVPIRARRIAGMDGWIAYHASSGGALIGKPSWAATKRGAITMLWERVVPENLRTAGSAILACEQARVSKLRGLLTEYRDTVFALASGADPNQAQLDERGAHLFDQIVALFEEHTGVASNG